MSLAKLASSSTSAILGFKSQTSVRLFLMLCFHSCDDIDARVVIFVHVENPYELDAAESLALEQATEDVPSVRERPTTEYIQQEDAILPPPSTNDSDTTAAALSTSQVPGDVKIFELQLMGHFKQVLSQWFVTVPCSSLSLIGFLGWIYLIQMPSFPAKYSRWRRRTDYSNPPSAPLQRNT